jgi:NitT/TauT family transport system substrate-binding protein
MSSRPVGRVIAIVPIVALIVGACGGAASSPSPSVPASQSVASPATSSSAQSAAPAGSSAASAAPGSSTAGQTYTVTMAQPAATIAGGPLYLAISKGFFAAHGITFKFITLNTATTVAQALISGSVQVSTGGAFNIVQEDQQGAGYQVIETFGSPTLQLCVSNAYAKAHNITPSSPLNTILTALKGAKVALNGFGSPIKIPLLYLLKSHLNVDPNTYVKLISLGSVPATQTAFESGQVDLLLNSPPICQQTKNGTVFTTWGFLPDFQGTPYQVFYGLKSWFDQNPGAAKAMALAMAEAGAFEVQNPQEAAQILHDKWFTTTSVADILDLINTYYKTTIPPDGCMTQAGWQKVNEIMVQSGVMTTTPSPADGGMWTNQYLSCGG